MVIRDRRAYLTRDQACAKECGNWFNPLEWPCYAEKTQYNCGGGTNIGDLFGPGNLDVEGPVKSSICAKNCDAPGEDQGACRSAKLQANCGGFSIFNEIGSATSSALNIPKPLLVLGGGLVVVLILVLLLRKRR